MAEVITHSEQVIKVEKLFHREIHCLAIRFPYNAKLIARIKTVPGATFSRTNTCWYIETRDGLAEEIIAAFSGKVLVDVSSLIDKPVPELSEGHLQTLRMMEQKLTLRGYSFNTRKTYLQQFKGFLKFYSDTQVTDLTDVEIRNYLLYLVEQKKVSNSIQNQTVNAIKFFYEKILLQERKVYYLERPIRERRLPEILSQQQVMALFEAIGNIKHRVMLMLVYAAGLRRSELLALRVGDVDLDRSIVFIRGGKGHKDRQSIMAQSLTPLLREYLVNYNPVFWLFEGIGGERYSATSVQQVLKRAAAKAEIKKNVRLHMLRHSFATHLLEAGTSTRYIQVLLGHESPVTTELYAQVTRFGLDKIRSPLDHIVMNRQLRDEVEN